VPKVGCGNDVVDSVSGDADAPFAGVVMTTGTDVEDAFVTVF